MEFYRFPAMAQLDEYTNMQQCAFICGEANEAIKACADMIDSCTSYKSFQALRDEYGMELMDVIHAAETALRMEFCAEEIEDLRSKVEEKNSKRGYYGKEA